MMQLNEMPGCATPTHGSDRCAPVSAEDTELVERVLQARQEKSDGPTND